MHGHLNFKYICCVVNYFLTFEVLVITRVFHTSVCTSVLRPNSFYAYTLISYHMKNHFVCRRRRCVSLTNTKLLMLFMEVMFLVLKIV